MPRPLAAPALLLGLLLGAPAAQAAGIVVTSNPSPIVLGEVERATIDVLGLPGDGPLGVAVNVGAVERQTPLPGGVRLTYRAPAQRFPQLLCLALWREGAPGTLVVRVPLHGRTAVDVTTRPRSDVTLAVGGRVFGPRPSGPTGRLRMNVIVAPGITEGHVQVIDQRGLETRRPVPIGQPDYNLLTVAARPERVGPADTPRVEVVIAEAERRGAASPRLELVGPGGGAVDVLEVEAVAKGRYRASWAPETRPRAGRWSLTALLPDQPANRRTVTVVIDPPPASAPVAATQPAPPPPPTKAPRRLVVQAAVAAGLLHNLGALASPSLGLEVGLEHPLPGGRLAGFLLARWSWASQDVPVTGFQPSRATVLLAPLGAGARWSFGSWRVSPYLTVAVLAQLVRSHVVGPQTGDVLRWDVKPGVLGGAGAGVRLWRGSLFLQGAYQWSQLENEDLALLAGGLLLEAGYRLSL